MINKQNINDINELIHSDEFVPDCLLWLGIVTICTADQNNGILNGNLTAICDLTYNYYR